MLGHYDPTRNFVTCPRFEPLSHKGGRTFDAQRANTMVYVAIGKTIFAVRPVSESLNSATKRS